MATMKVEFPKTSSKSGHWRVLVDGEEIGEITLDGIEFVVEASISTSMFCGPLYAECTSLEAAKKFAISYIIDPELEIY